MPNHRPSSLLIRHLAACLLWAWTSAHAQVKLPLQLPRVPDVTSSLGATKTVPALETTLDATLRQVQIRELLRRHQDVLERDPHGEPVVRGELLGFDIDAGVLQRLQTFGFIVVRTTTLEGLGSHLVVLKPPGGHSIARSLKQLRELDPQGSYDFNHIYTESGETGSPATVSDHGVASHAATSIGLIDAGIDHQHSALRNADVVIWGCGGRAVPSVHGTAIASLMIGNEAKFHGVSPAATLFAADVYCDLPTGGAVETIAAAFAWLASHEPGVINVSLVGPSNATLQRVVRLVTERGHLIVAAVGNDGPTSPPLYPAAYPGVVAVTGIDKKRRVLVEAVRGQHVMFAAPGADMIAASSADTYAEVRGTSFASPIVAALLATRLHHPNRADAQAALESLQHEAIDLGVAGRDNTFGFGVVGEQYRVEKK